ncbi:hypothetical protein E4L95_06365 [Paracoccus liaowanqingii]|uniref:Peptidase C39 domain-containing protein n=1 Tax=Paracoccus liaowanqingii TaxID=2560053 RepID=A0A4Z1CAW9_9RHOB|nr:hypothetical protein E4L95_06365 [Paracoccus liaowanqingii]
MPRVLHPGADLVAPYQQGQLDSLCGLYAVINAIRVVHAPKHPLSGKMSRHLFHAGAKALMSASGSRQALHQGMSAGRQYKLAKVLMRTPALASLPPLQLREKRPRLRSRSDLELFVRKTIGRGAVLLVDLEGRLSHHTVIIGLSNQRLLLCDSSGMRFVYASTIARADDRLSFRQIASVPHLTHASHRDAATLPCTWSERLLTHSRQGIHCQAGNTSLSL